MITNWGEFFARYEAMAIRFAAGLIHDPHSAADLFQEAARTVWQYTRDGREFESLSHARNYLFKVIRNLAIDGNRSPQPAELTEDPWAAEQRDRSAERERDQALWRAMEELRADERDALELRFGLRPSQGGLGYREIAARTGTSISTLQARVESALKKIRQQLGKSASPE